MLKGDVGVLGSHPYKLVITGQDKAFPYENSPGFKIIRKPTSRQTTNQPIVTAIISTGREGQRK